MTQPTAAPPALQHSGLAASQTALPNAVPLPPQGTASCHGQQNATLSTPVPPTPQHQILAAPLIPQQVNAQPTAPPLNLLAQPLPAAQILDPNPPHHHLHSTAVPCGTQSSLALLLPTPCGVQQQPTNISANGWPTAPSSPPGIQTPKAAPFGTPPTQANATSPAGAHQHPCSVSQSQCCPNPAAVPCRTQHQLNSVAHAPPAPCGMQGLQYTAGPVAGTQLTSRHIVMVPYRTVDAQLGPKLRQKIWQNEFINLRLLSKPEFADANQMLKLDQQGNIQMHEVLKGQIKGVVEWNEAWRVFMLTALQNSTLNDTQNVALSTNMITYMHFINGLYAQNGDFIFYDENFRQYKQYSPTTSLTMCFKPRPLLVVGLGLVTRPKTHHKHHPLTLTPCPVPLGTTHNHRCSQRPTTNWRVYNFHKATAFFTWPPCHVMRASVLTCTSVPAVGAGMLCCAVSNSSPARCNRTAAAATPIGLPMALRDQTTMDIFKGLDHSDNQWTMFICNPPPTRPGEPTLTKSIPPVINVSVFANLILNYDPNIASCLISGFSGGFSLGFEGPLVDFQITNLPSASKRPQVMMDLINAELQKGRFLGPFAMKPLPIFCINPIGFVLKKTPNSLCLITDLSQPSGTSVNDGIPRGAAKVQYPTIQQPLIISCTAASKDIFPIDPKWM